MVRLSFLISVFFLLLAASFVPSAVIASQYTVQAQKGVMDLRNIINDSNYYDLEGEWGFFANELLSPKAARKQRLNANSIFVPQSWDLSRFNEQADPNFGYGTYYLKIMVGEEQGPLAIHIPVINTAYRLYIEDDLTASAGKVGTSAQSFVARFAPQTIIISNTNSVINLTIQVANYNYKWGGVNYPLQIGKASVIAQNEKKFAMYKILIFGFLLAIGIYTLILFLLRNSNKVPLIFSLLCMTLGIRELLVEEFIILNFFPHLTVRQLVSSDHLTFYCASLFTLHFNYLIFVEHFKKYFLIFSYAATATLSLILLLFGLGVSHVTLLLMQLFTMAGLVYIFYVLFLGLRAKQKGTPVMLLGSLVISYCVINDILYAKEMIQSVYLGSFGIAVYVLAQCYMTAINLNEGFSQSERLGEQLTEHNLKLKKITMEQENKIAERTNELAKANDYLKKQSQTDALTNALNRHGLKPIVEHEEARFMRTRNPYSVALLDIDHFKTVNDKYGHDAGDHVLKMVSEIIKSKLRHQDKLARWGGEEFVLLLPETSLEGGLVAVEKIRATLEESVIETADALINITVSIGLAEVCQYEDFNMVLKRADIAVFKGKEQGRNQIVS